MVNQRGLSPIAGQQEEVVGTQHLGLGHGLLLEGCSAVLEVVNDKIVLVDGEVQELVVEVNGLWGVLITELVNRAAKLVVAIVATTIVHIVTRVVGQHLCGSIDARAFTVSTALSVECKALVGGSQSLQTVGIVLIEVVSRHRSLLFDVKLIFTCRESASGTQQSD